MVLEERLAGDVTVNVLLELDTDGDEFIWIQVLKLSEDAWKVPEQEVSEVFVVTEVVSIVSEKVTEIEEVIKTDVSESAGEDEETVGAVVSVSPPVSVPVPGTCIRVIPKLRLLVCVPMEKLCDFP